MLALYRPGIVEATRRQPELQEATRAAINAVGRRLGQNDGQRLPPVDADRDLVVALTIEVRSGLVEHVAEGLADPGVRQPIPPPVPYTNDFLDQIAIGDLQPCA